MNGERPSGQASEPWAKALGQVGAPPPPRWTPPPSTAAAATPTPTAPQEAVTARPPPEAPATRRPPGAAIRLRMPTSRNPLNGNVAWLVLGALSLGLAYPIPAGINLVRAVRATRGQDARGLGALRAGPARTSAGWAAVFVVLTLIAYPLVILAASRPPTSTARPTPPATVNVALGTTEAIAALAPGGRRQLPATLTMSDLVFPASGVAGADATARARVCAGPRTIDPLSGVIDVQLVDTLHREYTAVEGSLPEAFYAGLAGHECLSGTLAFELPSGSTPRSLTLLGMDLKTINWSSS